MTLLGAAIPIPAFRHPAGLEELSRGLLQLWPRFLSLLITFIVLGTLWVGHQNQFRVICKANRLFLWVNLMFYLFICLLPFCASWLGTYPYSPVSILAYALVMGAAGLLLYAHWRYALENGLVESVQNPEYVRRVSRRILAGPFCCLIAVALAFVNTGLSMVWFVIPALFQILSGRIDTEQQ